MKEQLGKTLKSTLILPIYSYERQIGSLFLFRRSGAEFSKEESDFISRISETLGIALRRIEKLLESSILKDQWQATFNSLTTPFALIRSNYDVIESNPAFQRNSKGTKCYQIFFNRTEACPNCRLGRPFELSLAGKDFEVLGQNLEFFTEEPINIHIYYDVSEARRLTQTLLESARVREMGSITSSIAHELNNPLGGILSFIHLIKTDLPPEAPLHADLAEMEKAVDKCREIVKNLLEFVRRSNPKGPVY